MRALFLAALLIPMAGEADELSALSPDANTSMPRCGPQMDGQVYCKFGVIYECEFIDPHAMERRTGWRWKADILRSCADASPATTDRQSDLPPGFSYAPQQTNGSSNGYDESDGQSGSDAARNQSGSDAVRSRPPTMYIRPDGSTMPGYGRRRD